MRTCKHGLPPDRSWIEFEKPFADSMLWALTGLLALIPISFIIFCVVTWFGWRP